MPIPLYGAEGNEWKLISRPTIPFLFSQPIPGGPNMFDAKRGIGDIQLPMIISPPVKNWIRVLGHDHALDLEVLRALVDAERGTAGGRDALARVLEKARDGGLVSPWLLRDAEAALKH